MPRRRRRSKSKSPTAAKTNHTRRSPSTSSTCSSISSTASVINTTNKPPTGPTTRARRRQQSPPVPIAKDPIPPTQIPPPASPSTSQAPNPTPPNKSQTLLIQRHIKNPNNPIYLSNLIKTQCPKLRLPRNYFSPKTGTTTLQFDSLQDLQTFCNAIPATTFGPNAAYKAYQSTKTSPKPKDPPRNPLKTLVIRGVEPSIDVSDFQEALEEDKRLQIAFCKRIQSDRGPTGLIRVFTHNANTVHLLLTEGAFVAGRHFKTEESRQLERHIPCPRCHLYGHTAHTCSYQPRCRVCGHKTPTSLCPHKDHDLSTPFCATCNSSIDHYTGQTKCPKYPRDTPVPASQAPVVPIVPASPPKTNPWKPQKTDFPALNKALASAEIPKTKITDDTDKQTEETSDTETQTDTTTDPKTTTTMDATTVLQMFKSMMEDVQKMITEMTKSVFDALIGVIYNVTEPTSHTKLRTSVNQITKRLFNTRTLFNRTPEGLTILHSKAQR